jgi:multidrug efflux pump subunit AcrA (membrane-fusion protein)
MNTIHRASLKACVLASAAAATLLSLASCARKAEVVAKPALSVRTAKVEKRDFSIDTLYAARLVADKEVSIIPKVGGRVASVRASLGSAVTAGQVLFTLETGDYDAQYRQAQAALQSANAALTRTSDAGQGQQIIQAQAAVDAAQVAFDDAKGLYEKTQRLFDGGAVAKQQLDDVEARYKGAAIQLDSAKQSLALVRDRAGPQSADVASGQRDQASAQADLAKRQLDSTVIRSPIAGKVSLRNVEVGELVGPSSLAFVVIDDRYVLAEAGLSERVVGRIRAGMRIPVSVDALGETDGRGGLSGVVQSVSPAADPRTMLYQVRVRLDNKDGRLKAGMLARLRIPVAGETGALLVPERAVFSSGGGDAVYVVEGGLARLRPVSLGESDGSFVQVRQGLAEGDSVITEGQEFLADGDPVSVK